MCPALKSDTHPNDEAGRDNGEVTATMHRGLPWNTWVCKRKEDKIA